MAESHAFRTRGRLRPSHSLLGLVVRRFSADDRQAEAWYLIAICTGFMCCLVAQFLLWSLWSERLTADSALAVRFWFWQCAAFLVLCLVGAVGFGSGVEVQITDQVLHARQGRRTCSWRWETIDHCQILPALTYHREHAPYVDVTPFMNRLPSNVLLVTSDNRHLAIGMTQEVHLTLHELIESRTGSSQAAAPPELALHDV